MKGLFLIFSLLLLGVSPLYASELPKEIKSSCIQDLSNGCIDWEKGVIYATGMGVPNESMKSVAQKRYSAMAAAKVIAMRNLLQMIEETQLSSSQTVKMGMLESDVIKTEIHGSLKQVTTIGKPRELGDGAVLVTVAMYMKDIRRSLMNNDYFQTSAQPVAKSTTEDVKPQKASSGYGGDTSTIYSGLILDARGTGVKPAMSPKVLDADGKEVYGSFVISRKFALQFGVAGYLKDMEKAKTNKRVVGNPLLLKASLHSSKKASDLVISAKDAKLLREATKKQTFLREARVIILL